MVKTQNIDTELLDDAIKKSGLRPTFLADTLGISRQMFNRKRRGMNSFRLSEVYVMASLLGIDDEMKDRIFFPKIVNP